jgi:hypothetical protein
MGKDQSLDEIALRWAIPDKRPSLGKASNPLWFCNAEDSKDKATPPSAASPTGRHRLCAWSGTKARFPGHVANCPHALATCKAKCKEYCKSKSGGSVSIVAGSAVGSSNAPFSMHTPASGSSGPQTTINFQPTNKKAADEVRMHCHESHMAFLASPTHDSVRRR